MTLSDEDLKAIRALVREELAAVEQRVDSKLSAVEQRVDSKLSAAEQGLGARIEVKIAESEARTQEFMRDIETSLLTAFHGYAKGQTARVHTVETEFSDLRTRMHALEERVLNLETRRPPQ